MLEHQLNPRFVVESVKSLNLHLFLLPDILALQLSGKLEKGCNGCRTRDNREKSKMKIEYNSQEK